MRNVASGKLFKKTKKILNENGIRRTQNVACETSYHRWHHSKQATILQDANSVKKRLEAKLYVIQTVKRNYQQTHCSQILRFAKKVPRHDERFSVASSSF